jgi:hypothetical protein
MAMKTILFDASIHFGQFCINNEDLRIRCKNSQAMLLPNEDADRKGFYTYFENGWMDSVIWNLEREVQDIYYPFMDVFFSNKNISGLADNIEEMSFATMLATKFPSMSSSSAITCALAVTRRADEVHTLYKSMLDPRLIKYMQDNYGVLVQEPPLDKEINFTCSHHNLEELYQASLVSFKKGDVALTEKLHDSIG